MKLSTHKVPILSSHSKTNVKDFKENVEIKKEFNINIF